MKYKAGFYKEKKGGYTVFLADYDAATCGEDIEEARNMAKELLELYIEAEGARKEAGSGSDLEQLYLERTGGKEGYEAEHAHFEYIEL